ncbi:hypothetical protein [Streptomyces justiciae]|uniref:hypothetical protein n=1 Tax=Streptomyces justiciae TaxID=2780140 RepID=UPI002244933A|nr:hypothetical protein [Streptomyces justiciae]MCW8382397.1 hypothetical protein [Streptomyces justiciae]
MEFDTKRKPWDAVDGPALVRSAAALQLIPENIPCLVRLQRLAAVGACLPSRPEAPRLSPSKLRSLLKDPVISSPAVRSQEDPYNDLYTAEVPFHGGPYLVAQGLTERSAYTLSLVLRSVFGPQAGKLPAAYRREAGHLVQAVLGLSNALLARAGLTRGLTPPAATRKDVFVPGERALDALREAVTFDDAALSAIAPPQALQALDSLSTNPGTHVFATGLGPDDGMILTPLLTAGPTVIVANPGELATALRHRLFTLATDHDCGPQLSRLIRACVLQEATEILMDCGATPLQPTQPAADDLPISRRQFTFADDKYLDLAVMTDDLSDYDPQEPYGFWDAGHLVQQLHQVLEAPAGTVQDDTQCLRLVINQGLGRSSVFGLRTSSRPGPRLATTVDDLRVMAELDGTDPLFLWRFAKADEELHADTMVQSFSTLDNYGMYRDHHYSYYLSDEGRPTAVMVNTDFSQALRTEAHQRHDHHAVISPHRPALIPVVALYGVDTAPIYRTHPSVPEDELLVETEDLHVWVQPDKDTTENLRAFLYMAAEAVAYWAWQFSLTAPDALRALADAHGRVRITTAFDDPHAWQTALAGHNPQPAQDLPWIAWQASNTGIHLELQAAGLPSLLLEDNSADRMIVKTLAEAAAPKDDLSQADLLVERIAPHGHKKMLHAQAQPMLLRPGPLPAARLVQPAVSAAVLDELGTWLQAEQVKQGNIPDDKRLEVLNKTVQHYFQHIQDAIAGLAPENLMNQLLARHEALIRAEAYDDELLTSRIACFGPSSQPAAELAKNSRQRIAAAQASRFLIEYTAATPPSGDCPLTLDTYDMLLAIAAELISRATLSDAIRHDFSTAQLSLLESGRLGVSRGDRYETGIDALALARAHATMTSADQEPLTTTRPRMPTAPSAQVEQAMLAEFGFTLTELAHGIGELIALGDAACDNEPFTAPVSDVQEHLRSTLGWTDEKAHAFLDRLSLRPRDTFLSVGAEAWPWRYNRAWSYARRPLIRLTAPGGELLAWAPRHTWSTGLYWVDLVYSGRLKATSAAMKKLLGSIRQDHNKHFETQAEAALADAGCPITAHSVGKIAGRRLVSPQGDDLGDIDAIGIHPEHKMIFVVEAKDFEMARNPSELANEADALLRGDKSAAFKIARRAQWIRTHLALTLRHFTNTADTRGWSVAPAVVTSRDLMTSRVLTSDVPVMTLRQLTTWAAELASHGKRNRRRTR